MSEVSVSSLMSPSLNYLILLLTPLRDFGHDRDLMLVSLDFPRFLSTYTHSHCIMIRTALLFPCGMCSSSGLVKPSVGF